MNCNAKSLCITSMMLMTMSKNPTLSQKVLRIGSGCQKGKNYLQVCPSPKSHEWTAPYAHWIKNVTWFKLCYANCKLVSAICIWKMALWKLVVQIALYKGYALRLTYFKESFTDKQKDSGTSGAALHLMRTYKQ